MKSKFIRNLHQVIDCLGIYTYRNKKNSENPMILIVWGREREREINMLTESTAYEELDNY